MLAASGHTRRPAFLQALLATSDELKSGRIPPEVLIEAGRESGGAEGDRLYDLDRSSAMRFSHENPQVQALYREYLGEPLGERSEELLHTDHLAWEMPH